MQQVDERLGLFLQRGVGRSPAQIARETRQIALLRARHCLVVQTRRFLDGGGEGEFIDALLVCSFALGKGCQGLFHHFFRDPDAIPAHNRRQYAIRRLELQTLGKVRERNSRTICASRTLHGHDVLNFACAVGG